MVKKGKSYELGKAEGYDEGWEDAFDALDRILIVMLYQSEIGLVPDTVKIEDMLKLVREVRGS